MSDSILQVNQIKDKGGNATGITVADSTANVTINNLAAGSIADAVTQPNTLYVQGTSQSGTQVNSSGEPFNLWN